MEQFPIGHRVKVALVARDLTRAGVPPGDVREGVKTDPQEQNILISLSKDPKYGFDEETREIWRKG